MAVLQGSRTPIASIVATTDVTLDADGNWFRVVAGMVATGAWTVQAMYLPDGATAVPVYPGTVFTLAGAVLAQDIPITGGYPGLFLRCTNTAPGTLDVYVYKGNDRAGGV